MYRLLNSNSSTALLARWSLLNIPIALLILLGAVSIFGWKKNYPGLIQLIPTAQSGISFNTSIAFLLLGCGLSAALYRKNLIAFICGILMTALSLVTLAEHLSLIQLEINKWFHSRPLSAEVKAIVMAPNTALCFFLSSWLLLLELGSESFWKKNLDLLRFLYWLIGSIVVCIALIALIGHFTGISTAYDWGKLTGMALQTALGFIVSGSLCILIAWLATPTADHRRVSITCSIVLIFSLGFSLFNYQWVHFNKLKKHYLTWQESTKLLAEFTQDQINKWFTFSESSQWQLLINNSNPAEIDSLVKNIIYDSKISDNQNLTGLYHVSRTPPFSVNRLSGFNNSNSVNSLPNFNWQPDDFNHLWWFLNEKSLWIGHSLNNSDMVLFEFDLQNKLQYWLNHITGLTKTATILIKENLSIPVSEKNKLLSYANTSENISHEFTIQNKNYQISVTPNPYLFNALDTTAIQILLATLTLGILITILVYKSLKLSLLRELTISIQNASPSGLIGVDHKGLIVFANPAAESMFGYSRHELIGNKIESLVPENLRLEHKNRREIFHQAHTTQSIGRSGLSGLTKQGQEIPIDVAINYANTEHGMLAIASIIDMRIHKSLENELRSQHDKLEKLINSVGDGIVGMDAKGHVTFINSAALDMLGYTIDQMQQYPLLQRLQTNSHDLKQSLPIACPIFNKFSQGKPFTLQEATFWDVNDRPHFVEYICTPLYTENNLSGTAMIFRDISRRKAVEALMLEHTQKLETINQELEEFSYVASHDLREPLRTIKNYASLLVEDIQENNQAEIEKDIHYIHLATDSMSRLIEGLLLLSKAGRMTYQHIDVDLNICLKNVITNLDQFIRENEAVIDCPDPLPNVMGDPVHITRVLQNLIHNGIKFHKPNVKPYIRIVATANEENTDTTLQKWRIYVIDNGIGIDSKHHHHIFDAFKRLHTQKEYQGTGIGLAVVRRIIERHQGKVGIESPTDGGSCFYFDLEASLEGAQDE